MQAASVEKAASVQAGIRPANVVQDTHEERRTRAARNARVKRHLEQSDEGRAQFDNLFAMLGYCFAMYELNASAKAIDPSREQIQGGSKADRDERITWVGKMKRAVAHLEQAQGHPDGVRLLWLAFRVPMPCGTGIVDGRTLTKWTAGAVPLDELYKHDSPLNRSKRHCQRAFWEAVEELETYCLNLGWVAGRVRREKRAEQTYRRAAKKDGGT